MAKVFTTEFFFREMIYAALVSVHKKREEVSFQVHLYDTALYKYIPGGQLLFSGDGSLLKPRTLEGEQAKQLVDRISEAISPYIYKAKESK